MDRGKAVFADEAAFVGNCQETGAPGDVAGSSDARAVIGWIFASTFLGHHSHRQTREQ